MTLANINAPNEDDNSFYINVIQLIESLPNDNQIIGGDFNLVLDLEIDKKKGGGEEKLHIGTHNFYLKTGWMMRILLIFGEHSTLKKKCIHGID